MNFLSGSRRLVSRCLQPLAARASRAYVAGDTLADALVVSDALFDRGLGSTLGYWDSPGESPRHVANVYLAALKALACREHAYLSVKLPAIDCRSALMEELVEQAICHRVRLHVDAQEPERADESRALVDGFLESGAEISVTLPGRWSRGHGWSLRG